MKRLSKCLIAFVLLISILSTFVLVGCSSEPDYEVDITLYVNNKVGGKVYGSGSYKFDEDITICALPSDGYVFQKWDDGDTNPIRILKYDRGEPVKVIRIAYFTPIVKHFAIDNVEIYAENIGDVAAESFEFYGMKIKLKDNAEDFFDCSVGSVFGLTNGACLINNKNIKVTKTTPMYFTAKQNSLNNFANGSKININFELKYQIAFYPSSEEPLSIVNGTKIQEFQNIDINETLLTSESAESRTYMIYQDIAHGFRVFAKLNFVEL